MSAGYLAVPVPTADRPGPWPGVVLVHDVFGMSDDMREQADWLAAAGYVVSVPDLYAKDGQTQGWGRVRCLKGTFASLKAGHGAAFDVLEAARADLAGRQDCTGTVGTIGYCMGGGFALLLAPRPGWSAASVNYGMLPEDLDVLGGACPVVASYGGADRSLPDAAEELAGALETRGVVHDVKEYAGARHGFINRLAVTSPLTPILKVAGIGYDHAAAADAKERILAFFEEHLRAAA